MKFIENKYLSWYLRLMDIARSRAPVALGENHHVIPRSLGGGEGEVVRLSYREHFIAHWLLVKFTEGKARVSMQYALCQMCGMTVGRKKARVEIGSWRYAVGRRAYIEARRARVVTQETKDKMRAVMLGRTFTPEWRAKLRAAALGKIISAGQRAKLRTANLGKTQSDEARKKNSAAHLGKKKSLETRARMSAGKRGHVTSDETKEKIRIGNINFWVARRAAIEEASKNG